MYSVNNGGQPAPSPTLAKDEKCPDGPQPVEKPREKFKDWFEKKQELKILISKFNDTSVKTDFQFPEADEEERELLKEDREKKEKKVRAEKQQNCSLDSAGL